MIRTTLIAVFFGLTIASYANATLIAEWTFESSFPSTGGPYGAEGGVHAGASSQARAFHSAASNYNSGVGNGSFNSFTSTAWAIGDYYQFCTPTTGYETIVVSWDQAGSNTGPRDFQVKSIVDGYSAPLASYNVALSTWNTTTYMPAFHYSMAIPVLDNLASACFRLIDSTITSINGTIVQPAGTDKVDNVQFNGNLVPEPGTLALLGLGVLALIRRRR